MKNKTIELRAIENKDIFLLNKWSNDTELWSLLGGWHFPYSYESTKRWVENINCNNDRDQCYAISTLSGDILGTVNLSNIDWKNRSATYGIMLGEVNSRGKGYAKEAMGLLLSYAFDELGLMRLESDILDDNVVSLQFHLNAGWISEGVKKYSDYRGGEWHSKTNIAFTIDEYNIMKNR